ncbi:Cilia- and flagella-associated protein 52 [Eumeta japonica]|uniref:Cilia-and flagella-associated protein 52 n=1 Tax=Eumeta variegata TaxID=151549 RepID=A0A4C1Y123_EUMVA|nr:Cilia- and flagella-associated protein 52 [Eumeta japonica]
MAEAGFYSISTGDDDCDSAKCFLCGKELDGWESTDDPWTEHRNHAAHCAFVQLGQKENNFLVRVEALTFTCDERYMVSLGGRDDGCVVVWDCVTGTATASMSASRLIAGDASTLCSFSLRCNSFATGGDGNLRLWNVRADSKALEVVDVSLGKLRRCVRSLAISPDDTYGYAGTTLRIGTPMSTGKQVGRFQERYKVATEHSVHDAAFESNSTVTVPVAI